jgi:hypothetical protein
MIGKNLGNIERLMRLLMGTTLFVWALSRPAMNGIEWFVVMVSLALILNGVFQRWYLWFVLDINTNRARRGTAHTDPVCQV